MNEMATVSEVISCVEFNHDGDLLATGKGGGKIVIYQVSNFFNVLTWTKCHTNS